MIRRPRFAACALLAAGVVAARADAAPRTSSLAWVRMPGAESCIDARALAQAVELRLGRPAFVAPTHGDVAIEARIERLQSPEAWHATITVFDGAGARTGLRELQTERADCRSIDEELELVIALLIDPSAALAPPPALTPMPQPPFFAPLASPPAVVPAPLVCPPPPPAPKSSWRAGAAAEFVLGLGLLPSDLGVGVAIRAHVAPPRGPSFDLGVSFWANETVATTTDDPAFSLAYGWLSVCPFDATLLGNAFSACLGAQLGSLRVSNVGLLSKFSQEQLVFNLGADARVRRRFFGPIFGDIGLGIAVPTVRDRFYFTDTVGARHDVFQASPVTGVLDLGVGLELP